MNRSSSTRSIHHHRVDARHRRANHRRASDDGCVSSDSRVASPWSSRARGAARASRRRRRATTQRCWCWRNHTRARWRRRSGRRERNDGEDAVIGWTVVAAIVAVAIVSKERRVDWEALQIQGLFFSPVSWRPFGRRREKEASAASPGEGREKMRRGRTPCTITASRRGERVGV